MTRLVSCSQRKRTALEGKLSGAPGRLLCHSDSAKLATAAE